jgi:hypothetical protein
MTKAEQGVLESAANCSYDGWAFRGSDKRVARRLEERGLLHHAGWGLVDDSDYESGREYEMWIISDAGRTALSAEGGDK